MIHHKLENALVRAEELITVGNQTAALQLLHDAIVSRWFQHNLLALDAIMLKFVEICVELRRGRLAKDGLHQYRSISQNVNVAGLEAVMQRFVQVAEKKLAEAAATASMIESDGGVTEDLEQVPEETVASAWGVGLGDERERTGREAVTPWLRFVWEAYRIVLDICRHNAKLECLYRVIVGRAFGFCQTYQRKAEFRRLCDILRHHLGIIIKYPTQSNGVVLGEAASHQLQLELRFEQLTVATEMELWHEAFRSIEDIHGLFVLARKSAKPSLVMTYYGRLCRVFQMSNNYLYLAAALCKLFTLGRSQENETERVNADATMAVLAIVATPFSREYDITNTMSPEEIEAKNTRLAYFLGLQKAPTRASVIKELYARDILCQAEPTVQKLFSLINLDAPSMDKVAIESLLTSLVGNPEYCAFIPAIHRNFVSCIFRQVSTEPGANAAVSFATLNDAISMPKLIGITEVSQFDLDAFILDGCRRGDFFLKIDHRAESIRFERPCFAPAPRIEFNDALQNKAVQVLRMIELAREALGEEPSKNVIGEVGLPLSLISQARGRLEIEHRANLARKAAIERKKEMIEEAAQRREREEARERQLRLQAEREAEKVRLAEETARREAARREQEREEIRREQASKREEEEQKKKEAAARRANLEKMIAVVKRMDHLERAYRQEEIPLLREDYERQKREDRNAYEERTRLIKEKASSQHNTDIQIKHRLVEITDDYQDYCKKFQARKAATLESLQAVATVELEKAKATRREKVRARVLEQKEAEERRIREEEAATAAATAAAAAAAAPVQAEKESKPSTYVPPSRRNDTNNTTSTTEAFTFRSSAFESFGSSRNTTGTTSSRREQPPPPPPPSSSSGGAWRRTN